MTGARETRSSPVVDHNALVGPFPFRRLPDPTPERLIQDMDRVSIATAWTGHVPSAWYRDVARGNDELFALLAPHRARLLPVPCVNPGWPGWEREIERARQEHCPAVRVYPHHHGISPAGAQMAELAAACGEKGLALTLTVRFEDSRQKSRLDVAADLIGADIRNVVRADPRVRLLVAGADRAIVEEVHWGATQKEQVRILWDISWIWGAPEDHLGHLYKTVGQERFVFGTHFPFKLPESAVARLELVE